MKFERLMKKLTHGDIVFIMLINCSSIKRREQIGKKFERWSDFDEQKKDL